MVTSARTGRGRLAGNVTASYMNTLKAAPRYMYTLAFFRNFVPSAALRRATCQQGEVSFLCYIRPEFTVSYGSPYGLKEHKHALWRIHVLSTTLLKLYDAINGHHLTVSTFFSDVQQFSDKSQRFYGSPYDIKEHKNDAITFPVALYQYYLVPDLSPVTDNQKIL